MILCCFFFRNIHTDIVTDLFQCYLPSACLSHPSYGPFRPSVSTACTWVDSCNPEQSGCFHHNCSVVQVCQIPCFSPGDKNLGIWNIVTWRVSTPPTRLWPWLFPQICWQHPQAIAAVLVPPYDFLIRIASRSSSLFHYSFNACLSSPSVMISSGFLTSTIAFYYKGLTLASHPKKAFWPIIGSFWSSHNISAYWIRLVFTASWPNSYNSSSRSSPTLRLLFFLLLSLFLLSALTFRSSTFTISPIADRCCSICCFFGSILSSGEYVVFVCDKPCSARSLFSSHDSSAVPLTEER